MEKTELNEVKGKPFSALKTWIKDILNALRRNDSAVENAGKNELEDQQIEDEVDAEVRAAERLYYSQLGEIKDAVNNLLERGNGKDVYEYLTSCGFDENGFHLFYSAEEISGIDICNVFKTEREIGHFKEMSWHDLLKWVEIGKFATGKEYEHLSGDRELLKSYNSIDYDSAKYLKYQKELWPLAVQKVMDHIGLFELDTNSMEHMLTRLNEFQNEPHTCLTDEVVQKKEEEENQRFASYCEQVKDITDNLLEHKDAKEIYEFLVSCGIDEDGFQLYWSAEELLKKDPTDYFDYENNHGFFAEMDGHGLLKWAEIAKFAECEYELECVGCYEILKSYDMDYNSPEYLNYRKQLWPLAVQKVMDSIKPHMINIKPLENLLTQLTAFQNGESIKPLERVQVENVYFKLQREPEPVCEENENEMEPE